MSPERLRPTTVAVIDEAALRNSVYIAVVSVWELAMHVRAGKILLNLDVSRWVEQALAKPGINLRPYTPQIAIESAYLPAPMHKDPSDRILIATAAMDGMTIVTADKAMLAFAKATRLPSLRA